MGQCYGKLKLKLENQFEALEVHVDRFCGKGHEGVVHGIMNITEHSFLEETYW